MVVDPISTMAPPCSTVGSATTVSGRQGASSVSSPMVAASSGESRATAGRVLSSSASARATASRPGSTASTDSRPNKRLQQLEDESGHRALELGGPLLVGGACGIYRATQGGDGVVRPEQRSAARLPWQPLRHLVARRRNRPRSRPVGRHALHQRARRTRWRSRSAFPGRAVGAGPRDRAPRSAALQERPHPKRSLSASSLHDLVVAGDDDDPFGIELPGRAHDLGLGRVHL